MIPSGFIYQWADKEFLPLCLEKGWTKVPFSRHSDFFNVSCQQNDGSIKVEHVWLLEKASDAVRSTRETEIQKAIENKLNAAENIGLALKDLNASNPDIQITASIKVSTDEISDFAGDTQSSISGRRHNKSIDRQLDEQRHRNAGSTGSR